MLEAQASGPPLYGPSARGAPADRGLATCVATGGAQALKHRRMPFQSDLQYCFCTLRAQPYCPGKSLMVGDVAFACSSTLLACLHAVACESNLGLNTITALLSVSPLSTKRSTCTLRLLCALHSHKSRQEHCQPATAPAL